MIDFTTRTFNGADMDAVQDLQQAYASVYPGAKVIPAGAYLSPAFHQGQDVFCAFCEGRLAAYAPLYLQLNEGPAALPHRAWVEVKAHPGLPGALAVKDHLLGCLTRRIRQLLEEHPGGAGTRPVQVIFEYMTGETDAVSYVTARGFAHTESVFAMQRYLKDDPLPETAPLPAGITLRRWRMEEEAGPRAYVTARNACFPESPISLEEWQYFLSSPLWAVGTLVAAFEGDCLAGCASIYWNAEENQRSSEAAGYTDDIFVLPAWRGRGIARAMIVDGLRYLQEHGMSEARLMVRALNDNALSLYRKLGFRVTGESRFYGRELKDLPV